MLTIIKKTKKSVTVQNDRGKISTVKDWCSFWGANISESDFKILLKEVKDIFPADVYSKLKEKISPTPKQKKAQLARTKAANKYFLGNNPYLDLLEKNMQADPGFCPWTVDREYGKSLVTPEASKLIRF